MANYLAGINAAASIATSFVGPSSSAAISTGTAALGALTSLTGFGGLAGSKPKALHTEFASGEANWQKPYGASTDIVFYLVRADKGAQGTANNDSGIFSPAGSTADFEVGTSLGVADSVNPTGQGFFSSASQTGPAFADGIQSPLNQVATLSTMDRIGNFAGGISQFAGVAQGLAGPLTGLNVNQEVQIGGSNQTFAGFNTTAASVANTVQSVSSLQAPRLSNAASAEFFQSVLTQSFAPGSPVGSATRNPDQILNSISNGSIADLSTMMSIASGGVTTSKQFIEGINKGAIGFTTQSSDAGANRLGPMGYSRERIAK